MFRADVVSSGSAKLSGFQCAETGRFAEDEERLSLWTMSEKVIVFLASVRREFDAGSSSSNTSDYKTSW